MKLFNLVVCVALPPDGEGPEQVKVACIQTTFRSKEDAERDGLEAAQDWVAREWPEGSSLKHFGAFALDLDHIRRSLAVIDEQSAADEILSAEILN